jgi:hypothetical protein
MNNKEKVFENIDLTRENIVCIAWHYKDEDWSGHTSIMDAQELFEMIKDKLPLRSDD